MSENNPDWFLPLVIVGLIWMIGWVFIAFLDYCISRQKKQERRDLFRRFKIVVLIFIIPFGIYMGYQHWKIVYP